MEKQDIWRKVDRAPVVNGMVTVDKPDDSVRITTDLSQLNKAINPFRFPLPLTFETSTRSCDRQRKYFSKLDLRKDYFNIDIDEDSSLLTTMITLKGLFAYKKLPH